MYFIGRKTRYLLGMLLIALVGHVGYQYIIATSTEVDEKTGTFVEVLTPGYEISYIPYTQTSEKTRPYQALFFDACLDYAIQDERIVYRHNICTVETSDNATYEVRLTNDAYRSDGQMVSLDDVYATYQKILVENARSMYEFGAYKDIAVERRAEDLIVTFPEPSIDNRNFFTHFIVPEYVANLTHQAYMDLASTEDIGSWCASLQQEVSDDQSIVINVKACQDTAFNNYQLKYNSLQEEDANYTYVDMIKGATSAPNTFMEYRIPSRHFPFLFFNVESKKLSPKIQRALGGYIDYNFQDEDYDTMMIDNQLIFTQFLSTGENVADYIAAKNPNLPVDKYDLAKLEVETLPTEIAIKRGDKPVYFLESIDGSKTLHITLDESYETVSIAHNGGATFIPKTYDPKAKKFHYTLATYNANLVEWVNEYTIKATKDAKEIVVAEIDVYFLTSPLQEKTNISDEDKIHVVYIYHPMTDYIVGRLKNILAAGGMASSFVFEGYDDPDSFEWRLLSQDYDMVLRMVDLGQRNDWRSLMSGKNPVLNPSLYNNAAFLTALEQYADSPNNESIISNVLTLYGKDMPFVVLGQMFDVVNLSSAIVEQIDVDELDSIYDAHRTIYNNVVLGKTLSISRDDIFNKQNLENFLRTWGSIDTSEQVVIGESIENTKESIEEVSE